MHSALGVKSRLELALFLAIVALVAITPMGREATAAPVLLIHRLLLLAITLGSLKILKEKREPEICPIYVALCVVVMIAMLCSILWNPGSNFNGFYQWYQYLFFGAAFLAMAILNRERSVRWKTSLLWAVIGVDVIYVTATLLIGSRPLIGPFVNPNYFASFLLVGFSVAIAVVLFGESRTPRAAAAAFAVFLYYGMTQAWSRGATVAAIAVVGLAIIRFSQARRISRGALIFALALALAAGAVASPSLVRKFFDRGQLDPYNYQRPQIWLSTLSVIGEHPFLGVGLGEFYYVSKRFSPPVEGAIARYLKRPAIAHSEYLQLAAETGIPAAMLLFALAAYLVFIAFRRADKKAGPDRVVQEAAILAAIGLGVHALVDNNWSAPIMASGLVVFSMADVLPLREWRLPEVWSPRARMIVAIGLVFALAHGIAIPALAVHFNEAGQRAYSRNDLVAAESDYRLAAALDPSNSVFLDNAGMTYVDKYMITHESRWLDYADTLLNQAAAANPNADEPRRHREIALIQRLTGNRETDVPIHLRIAEVDRDILRVDPYNPFVRRNLAEALYNSGQRAPAVLELKRAIELEPNFVPGYLRIADWLIESGNLQTGEEYRQRGLATVARYQNVKTDEPYEALLLGRPDPKAKKP